MFLDKPHEVIAPPIRPVSGGVRVSRPLIILLVIMILAALGLGAWWLVTEKYFPYVERQSAVKNENRNQTLTQSSNSNRAASSFVDGDSDDLYDEAELLYGTDPRVVDTDGDGFSDGDEVQHGYEPLIAEKGKRMVDFALLDIIGKSVANPVVVSSGMSESDRLRYYLVYDGSSTAYFAADGSLAAQCANDDEQGKCSSLPNEIRTDFSRTFEGTEAADEFHAPF